MDPRYPPSQGTGPFQAFSTTANAQPIPTQQLHQPQHAQQAQTHQLAASSSYPQQCPPGYQSGVSYGYHQQVPPAPSQTVINTAQVSFLITPLPNGVHPPPPVHAYPSGPYGTQPHHHAGYAPGYPLPSIYAAPSIQAHHAPPASAHQPRPPPQNPFSSNTVPPGIGLTPSGWPYHLDTGCPFVFFPGQAGAGVSGSGQQQGTDVSAAQVQEVDEGKVEEDQVAGKRNVLVDRLIELDESDDGKKESVSRSEKKPLQAKTDPRSTSRPARSPVASIASHTMRKPRSPPAITPLNPSSLLPKSTSKPSVPLPSKPLGKVLLSLASQPSKPKTQARPPPPGFSSSDAPPPPIRTAHPQARSLNPISPSFIPRPRPPYLTQPRPAIQAQAGLNKKSVGGTNKAQQSRSIWGTAMSEVAAQQTDAMVTGRGKVRAAAPERAEKAVVGGKRKAGSAGGSSLKSWAERRAEELKRNEALPPPPLPQDKPRPRSPATTMDRPSEMPKPRSSGFDLVPTSSGSIIELDFEPPPAQATSFYHPRSPDVKKSPAKPFFRPTQTVSPAIQTFLTTIFPAYLGSPSVFASRIALAQEDHLEEEARDVSALWKLTERLSRTCLLGREVYGGYAYSVLSSGQASGSDWLAKVLKRCKRATTSGKPGVMDIRGFIRAITIHPPSSTPDPNAPSPLSDMTLLTLRHLVPLLPNLHHLTLGPSHHPKFYSAFHSHTVRTLTIGPPLGSTWATLSDVLMRGNQTWASLQEVKVGTRVTEKDLRGMERFLEIGAGSGWVDGLVGQRKGVSMFEWAVDGKVLLEGRHLLALCYLFPDLERLGVRTVAGRFTADGEGDTQAYTLSLALSQSPNLRTFSTTIWPPSRIDPQADLTASSFTNRVKTLLRYAGPALTRIEYGKQPGMVASCERYRGGGMKRFRMGAIPEELWEDGKAESPRKAPATERPIVVQVQQSPPRPFEREVFAVPAGGAFPNGDLILL